jgi:hypothetical protein
MALIAGGPPISPIPEERHVAFVGDVMINQDGSAYDLRFLFIAITAEGMFA